MLAKPTQQTGRSSPTAWSSLCDEGAFILGCRTSCCLGIRVDLQTKPTALWKHNAHFGVGGTRCLLQGTFVGLCYLESAAKIFVVGGADYDGERMYTHDDRNGEGTVVGARVGAD